jgi:hypothetical protein
MRKREILAWVLLSAAVIIPTVTGVCEQPGCATLVSTTKTLWADFLQNPAMASALAACAAVVVALYFQSRNLQSTRESNSSKMVLDLFARFDSDQMRKHRKQFSAKLLAEQANVDLLHETPVLDMLQDVAHHTRRGVLDKEMVRSAFGWWVNGYYKAVTTPTNLLEIVREQQKNHLFYSEFEWLYKEVTKPGLANPDYLSAQFEKPEIFLPGEVSIVLDESKSQSAVETLAPVHRLEALDVMLDKELITQAEYDAKKREILNSI